MKRSTGWFLILFGVVICQAAFVVGLTRLSAATSTGRRHASVSGKRILDVRIEGTFPDRDPNSAINELLGIRILTLSGFEAALDAAAEDDDVAAAFVRVGSPQMGWARASEVRAALERFRASGKPVHAFLEGGDDGSYYIASAANEVRLIPSATLWLDGISADVTFYGGTLDKAGVRADLAQIGEYKNAADVMTRTEMTDSHRESMNSLLDGLWGELVASLATSLERPAAEVEGLLAGGPYTAQQALEAGLVKELAFRDQAEEALDRVVGGDLPHVSLGRYLHGVATPGGRDAIAVIHCSGTIVEGESSESLLGGSILGADSVAAALREAGESANVRAVVLRVDSPGGSPVASDIIWRETQRLRSSGTPVIVSMSDVAASGGYWIAMGADKVVALPATITGSIGVYGGKYVIEGLNDKLAIHVEGMDRGPNSAMNSSRAPYSDQQRARLQQQLDATYELFLQRAADGRGFEGPEAVDAVARGRVWTGRQALEHGLVDELGGLRHAIDVARQVAGIPANRPVSVRDFPEAPTLLEMFVDDGPSATISEGLRVAAVREIEAGLPASLRAALDAGLSRLEGTRILAWSPVQVPAR